MKAAFISSLASVFASVVAITAMSAITVVPQRNGWRDHIALIVDISLFVWLLLAFWSRPKASGRPVPRWVNALVVSFGIAYVLFIFLFTVG